MSNIIYETVNEGLEELKKAVSLRDKMGGALYFNICEDEYLKIADKLVSMGADKNTVAKIGGWELRK